MSNDDRYIAGVPCWIDLTTPDLQAAAAFYGGLFGWDFEEATADYLVARLEGGDVAAIGTQGSPPEAEWNTYVWVDDAEQTATRVREAGGSVLLEPADVGDSGRMAIFADPDGAAFRVWQAEGHRGAAVVNQPGSLNFNDLNTRDLETAQAFYGAVFGWELLPVGDGATWALPGYGDFLEQRNPGMRKGMAEMGAPERFEDVVASVRAIPAGDAGARPHWAVTFAVADADAIAERAGQLGGRVLLPPFDAPWVRMAVIADPQGAAFTASKFAPENR